MKPTCVVSCPIDTFSGYGARSRDFVKSLIESKGEEWDIKILPQRWGDCPWNFLSQDDPLRQRFIGGLQQQPAISTDPGSIAVVGTGKFDLIVGPNPSTTKTRSTTLTFFANETGGEISVDVTQAIRTALASTIVANNIATF